MNLVRHREVIVEIERLQVVRKRAKTHMRFCSGCGTHADFVTAREAASLFDTPERSLVNFVRANNCHNHMTISELHICLASLLAFMKAKQNGSPVRMLADESSGKAVG